MTIERNGVRFVELLAFATALLIRSAAGLALPIMLARAIDAVLTGAPSASTSIWLVACVIVTMAVAEVLSTVTSAYAVTHGTARLRVRLMRHLLAVRAADRLDAGDSTTRVVYASGDAAGVTVAIVSVATALVSATAALGILWAVDWPAGLVFTVLCPLPVVLARTPLATLRVKQGRYLQDQSAIAQLLLGALVGIRSIRAARTADREVARALGPLPGLNAAGREIWHTQACLVFRVRGATALVQAATLTAAGLSLAWGQVSPGGLAAVIALLGLALAGLNQIDTVSEAIHSTASRRRVNDAFSIPTARVGTRTIPRRPVSVTIRGLSHHAGLSNIDLELPAGTITAVVGADDGSTSLLAAMIGGLVEPDAGMVLLDGVPVAELNPHVLRAVVGYAFHDPGLLGNTVAEAIAYPFAADRARVIAAARLAFAHEFISKLPDGYDCALSNAPMSGGELQRVGLARAFFADPPVVVLDDATTGLDVVTEAQIRHAVLEQRACRTRLIVARRPETAAGCDRVVWLSDGRLAGSGTHAELWQVPAYRALFTDATATVRA